MESWALRFQVGMQSSNQPVILGESAPRDTLTAPRFESNLHATL